VISARPPESGEVVACIACKGIKHAPIAAVVVMGMRAQLHPELRVAMDARAVGRSGEADRILDAFNQSGDEALVHDSIEFALCEECGRDAANAIGFMCIRDGGWSKLEPRKRKVVR
jgi:hypothetical protein